MNFSFQQQNSKKNGFTLLELIVVLAIISLLGTLVVRNVIGRLDDARVTTAQTDIKSIATALQTYKVDNARYPTSEQGLQALVERPSVEPVPRNWRQKYIDRLPSDPWGNPYNYLIPGIKGEYDIFSYGADGQPGGEDNDADIGNWQ